MKKPPAEGGWNIFSTTVTGITFADPIAFTGQAANGEKAWFGWPSERAAGEAARQMGGGADARRSARRSRANCSRTAGTTCRTSILGQFFRNSAWRKNITGVIGMPEMVPFWNMEKKASGVRRGGRSRAHSAGVFPSPLRGGVRGGGQASRWGPSGTHWRDDPERAPTSRDRDTRARAASPRN